MRILQITAGAGGMYCGSCLRDNALAAEMMARGHDVVAPARLHPDPTDEPNVSDEHVFFGGISVYLEQKYPIFRKTPAILDKLWDSAPVIRMAAGRGVSVDPKDLGELTVSTLRGEEGFQAKEVRKLVDYVARQPPFDVVIVPMSLLLGLAPPLKRALGRPVVCTLQGDDLFLEGLGEPYRSESKALIAMHAPVVDAFVATSDYYSDFMAGYLGLPREKIHTVPLGISLEGHDATPRPRRDPFTSAISPASPPRRACTCSPRRTAAPPRARPPSVAAGGRRLHRARAPGVPGGHRGEAPRLGPPRGVPVSGALDRRGEARVPAVRRRAVGAEPVRGAEGLVPAGGDGQRRAGGRSAARRVPRDAGQDRRRRALRAQRRGEPGRRGHEAAPRPRPRRRAGTKRRGRA